jgi:hypothetical protein
VARCAVPSPVPSAQSQGLRQCEAGLSDVVQHFWMFSEGTLPIPYILIIVHSSMFMYLYIYIYMITFKPSWELFFWPQLSPAGIFNEGNGFLDLVQQQRSSQRSSQLAAAPHPWHQLHQHCSAARVPGKGTVQLGGTQQPTIEWTKTTITYDNMELQYVFSFQLSFWMNNIFGNCWKGNFPRLLSEPLCQGPNQHVHGSTTSQGLSGKL